MAVDEKPVRSLIYDINGDEISAYAENGYFKAFFDDEDDPENKKVIDAIRHSDFLYDLTPEAKEQIANNRLIPSNLKAKAEADAIEARRIETRDLYARLRIIQDRLISPYNNFIKTHISALESLLDGFPSDGLDDDSKARVNEINAQISKHKEDIISSKILVNQDNGELCLMAKIGNEKKGGFTIRKNKITLSSEEIEKETLRQMLFALGYKEGILGDMQRPEDFSKKLSNTIDEIIKDDEKRAPLDRAKIFINKSDKTEEELLDGIDTPLPDSVNGQDIPDVAGSTEVGVERVVVDRPNNQMSEKQREAKRDDGINMTLKFAYGLGYTGAGFSKPLFGIIPIRNIQKISQGSGDLKYRNRDGWDCFYLTNGSTDTNFRLATIDPKTGKITHNYQYMVATKVDKNGNLMFKYKVPQAGGKVPFELFEMIAENSKKQGATHVRFGNTRGTESTDIRKACAQELIVPVGESVDISIKHLRMMLEIAQKDKSPNDPRVLEYAKALAEQMKENAIKKSKDGKLAQDEIDIYNEFMNLKDVSTATISNYNLSKFKTLFSGGIEDEFTKLSVEEGKLDAVDVVSKMMAFKGLYASYKKVVNNPDNVDELGNTKSTVGDLINAIGLEHTGIHQVMRGKNSMPLDTELFKLDKGFEASKLGTDLFEAMSEMYKDKAKEHLDYKYTIKGRPEVSSEAVAANAVKELQGDLSTISADFKELVNKPSYGGLYLAKVSNDFIPYVSQRGIDGYNEKQKGLRGSHYTETPNIPNTPKKGGRS